MTGGGYKYCQLGEGNAFLRIPEGCQLRPAVTGWFAEFEALERRASDTVGYPDGAGRFAGSTYDPTSHYRGRAVFAFFDEQHLTPSLLREVSQRQIGQLATGIDDLDPDPALLSRDRQIPLAALGGFLALRSPRAAEFQAGLRDRGVLSDHRGDTLRLGPAPYLSDAQLGDAVAALGEVLAALAP